jgi:uncharacterized protein YjbI with pentapeptide repeats
VYRRQQSRWQIIVGRYLGTIGALNLRSTAIVPTIGVAATLILVLVVVFALWRAGGAEAVSVNAALIGGLLALGGVFTAQMVSITLEAQRAHEAALQQYFEQVGKLLIEKPLRRASPGDNLSTVVRAQTLTVLEGLDPARKGILLQFLYESGLILRDQPVVSLMAANLTGVKLSRIDLHGADLSRANLSGALLSKADLRSASLRGAFLREANLREAWLREADLSGAELAGADLSGADLIEADLSEAKLHKADLRKTALSNANLTIVELAGANLSGARYITNEALARKAWSLGGATMPNGQKYEKWIKERRAEGIEPGGPPW